MQAVPTCANCQRISSMPHSELKHYAPVPKPRLIIRWVRQVCCDLLHNQLVCRPGLLR